MNGKFFVGGNAISFSRCETPLPVSKVVLWVDDENCYEAGTDDGTVLEVDCPYATQDMANALLSSMKGYQYRPGEIEGSNLSPLAELGDGVTVGGEYIPLIRQYITLGNTPVSDFSAPLTKEIDHEYQYASPIQQQIKRNIARTRSLITKTSEAINLRIDGVNGEVSSLKVSLGNVQSEVSGKIDGSTAQSLINQSIDKIELSVSSGSGGSTFTLKSGSATLSTKTLDLHVKAINIDGTLKASQIQTGSIYVGDLADGSSYATKTYVTDNAGLSQTEVDDRIDTYIDSTSITAEILRGRTVSLMANRRTEIGTIELVDTTTGYGISISTYDGGIQLDSGGNVYITSAYRTRLQLDEEAAKIGPTVWATNGTVIYDSDRNVKNSIEYDLSKYRQFLLDLKPCRFKYNEGQSGRYHIGMIAQDMEQSLADNGIAASEFSGWCKMPIRDENHNITGYTYGIRYDSLIPLNTLMIQELVKRVEALERRS